MMASRSVGSVLHDLKERVDGLAAALVARDGTVLYAELPGNVCADTFAVMCATIVGAGVTAHGELSRSVPESIVINGSDSRTVIIARGTGPILVVVVDLSTDLSKVLAEVGKFTQLLGVG